VRPYRVHLIADEIAVGFGRTGTMFACRAGTAPTPPHAFAPHAMRPDFICLSKGITGGYLPLSAVLTTDDVYAAFYGDATARGFLHSHSYTGNPLACRAALAVLDIFEQDNVIAANRVKAIEFTRILAEVAAHTRVRHFRHLGMIWAFDVADADPGFCRPLPPGGAGAGRVHPADRQHRVRHAALRDGADEMRGWRTRCWPASTTRKSEPRVQKAFA
jgi:adenosylmethionine---8-amino-7-oxononanoate aminotransferase